MTKILVIGSDKARKISVHLSELFRGEFVKVCQGEACDPSADVAVYTAPLNSLSNYHMPFEIVIFSCGESQPSAEFLPDLSQIIHRDSIVIINGEDSFCQRLLVNTPSNIITFGFDYKSTITASSIENFADFKLLQLCIQRSFLTINKGEIPAQELSVKLSVQQNDASDVAALNEIAVIAAALSYGINLKTISLAY